MAESSPALEPEADRPSSDGPSSDRAHHPGGLHIRASGVALLALGLIAALGFVFIRGGLPYPLQPPPGPATGHGQVAVGPSPSPSPIPSVPSASPSAWPTASPSASPSPVPSPSPSVVATPSPSSTPTAVPTVAPTPTATPRSDRFAVLSPCPGQRNCWIYVIRGGDNLFSIAHWFGVSLAAIHDMNPWTLHHGLRAGQDLRIPTPTR